MIGKKSSLLYICCLDTDLALDMHAEMENINLC